MCLLSNSGEEHSPPLSAFCGAWCYSWRCHYCNAVMHIGRMKQQKHFLLSIISRHLLLSGMIALVIGCGISSTVYWFIQSEDATRACDGSALMRFYDKYPEPGG